MGGSSKEPARVQRECRSLVGSAADQTLFCRRRAKARAASPVPNNIIEAGSETDEPTVPIT